MFVIGFEKATNEPLRLRRRFHSCNCAFASLLVSQIAQRKAAQTLEAALIRRSMQFPSRTISSFTQPLRNRSNFLISIRMSRSALSSCPCIPPPRHTPRTPIRRVNKSRLMVWRGRAYGVRTPGLRWTLTVMARPSTQVGRETKLLCSAR